MRLFPRSRFVLIAAAVALLAAACGSSADSADETAPSDETAPADVAAPSLVTTEFPPAPATPDGPLDPAVSEDLGTLFLSLTDEVDLDALDRLAASGDPRIAWLFTDILRFVQPGSPLSGSLVEAFEEVTGTILGEGRSAWGITTDYLLAWDTPAPPDYVTFKRIVFELIEPGWRPFFADEDADIDWRWVSWGGVLIDDRPLAETMFGCPEGCIPALNDPTLVQAGTDDDWLDDDRVVFGIEVNDEAVAFPRNMMEVHEMVNMTIGGRRLGIPYCTLCGSAQAYLTDVIEALPDDDALAVLDEQQSLELRTSGLLSRSNKVMYEFHTRSVFDTFTGEAVSGPLQDAGLVLEQVSVLTTTWGQWKAEHPDSFVIARDGGIGRIYQDDPLRGRDDDGPIFPIGDVDPRLPVQEAVIGVIAADGSPVGFHVAALEAAGVPVTFAGVTVEASGGGFVATDADGASLPAHQAFWFAWSQFHPDTELWLGE
ncbi:MAG: DUF3179 domain-containing (seleno)protein [Actinomycetota bacterium]